MPLFPQTRVITTSDPNGGERPEWKKYAEDFDICELCNNTRMMEDDRFDKYRYFYDRLQNENFMVSLFGLPRFSPKKVTCAKAPGGHRRGLTFGFLAS